MKPLSPLQAEAIAKMRANGGKFVEAFPATYWTVVGSPSEEVKAGFKRWHTTHAVRIDGATMRGLIRRGLAVPVGGEFQPDEVTMSAGRQITRRHHDRIVVLAD